MKLTIRQWSVNVHVPRQRPAYVFIRFGLWDSFNQSYNHATGAPERGLSVYPAKWVDGAVALDESEVEAISEALADRYAFPVTGKIVGTGSDGEPVIRRVRVLPYALHINVRRK